MEHPFLNLCNTEAWSRPCVSVAECGQHAHGPSLLPGACSPGGCITGRVSSCSLQPLCVAGHVVQQILGYPLWESFLPPPPSLKNCFKQFFKDIKQPRISSECSLFAAFCSCSQCKTLAASFGSRLEIQAFSPVFMDLAMAIAERDVQTDD